MLTLAIGDLFIPDRIIELPPKFRKLLAPNAPSVPSNPRIAQVLCLGNITQSASTLRFLHELSPNFHIVRGEYDDYNILSQQLANLGHKSENPLPFYKVVTAENFRIGFTSGYQDVPRHDPLLLLTFAREIDVDILIWGGAHRVEAYTLDGKFFINPGSATGAFSFSWPEIDEKEDEEDVDKEDLEDTNENEPTEKTTSENDEIESKVDGDDADKKNDEKDATERDANGENAEPLEEPHTPTFCLLDTQGSQCTLFIYSEINGEVKVDKVMYQKNA